MQTVEFMSSRVNDISRNVWSNTDQLKGLIVCPSGVCVHFVEGENMALDASMVLSLDVDE